jgi:hypothetical protein
MKLTDENNRYKIINKNSFLTLKGAKKKVWKFHYQTW